MRNSVKSMIVAVLLSLAPATFCVSAVNEKTTFKEAYESTEILTDELFTEISSALTGMLNMINEEELLGVVDKLLANTLILEENAKKMNQENCLYEVKQMSIYLNRIRESILNEDERDHIIAHLSRYYLHYNNCIMNNIAILKQMQFEHKEELQLAIAAKEQGELAHLTEHLHIHSDQMYFALLLTDDQKFHQTGANVRSISDDIFRNALNGEMSAINENMKKLGPMIDTFMTN